MDECFDQVKEIVEGHVNIQALPLYITQLIFKERSVMTSCYGLEPYVKFIR